MTHHWHEFNPWADKLIYVPLETAAFLCGYSWTAETTLEHWRQYGDKFDAYVLPQPNGHHSIGVRYGAEGDEYLSPHPDPDKTRAFMLGYDAAIGYRACDSIDSRGNTE